ncbi:hypothetical protein L226DRAFT_608899 [Lentinus tigrinus ALCF2SS1-7]|uniref:Cytochrome b561 domain-containing protein n=1 Tax=Lentinus tigrinus ALCF2SS1-6 TaxID=1328759 RepID=A0A5C2SRJ5_9APHY|nr:hypothetical protein L227DRAFT_648781 [Lentinus tigrinus ALCF2SS1-6]RPD79917.1 hypothetical protein L226DRAFT_608899 [Lentinus tigrinus ALCF2SS1-7]
MPALASSTTPERSDPEAEPLTLDPDTPTIETLDMGFDEQFVKPEGRPGDVAAQWAAYISVGVFLLTTWIMTLSNNPTSLGLFFFHPILQSLSIAMFTYGILTLQPTSQAKTKAAGLTRHQLAMIALGVPAICLGTLAIVWRKSMSEHPHFTTWHGTIGIISIAWMVVQVALGGASVWFGGRLFGGNPRAKLVWKYHRLSGYLLFPLFLLAAHLGGAWSSWSTANSAFVVRLLAFTVSPIVLLAAILVRVRTSKMQFF